MKASLEMDRKIRTDIESQRFYLVKWKGYRERTWEPKDNLDDCSDVLKEY